MPNTIEQNLDRLVKARADIAKAINAKGGTVPTGDGLEEFAADISTIAPYEMTGELPLMFKSDGESLRDYAVKGKNVRTANLFDKDTVAVGKYISNNNGGIFDGSGKNASDYIDVGNEEYIYISCGPSASSQWAAFYDNSKNYVSGFTTYNRSIEVPQNAKFVRITVVDEALNNLMLNVGSTALPYEPYYDGIGERTANLFDIEGWLKASNTSYTKDGNSYTFNIVSLYANAFTFSMTNIDIALSAPIIIDAESSAGNVRWDILDGNNNVVGTTRNNGTFSNVSKIRLNYGSSGNITITAPMLNTGSTALPYEPHGYKIPITCGNTTTNLYTLSKLYEGDTLTYADTQTAIPTVDGVNTLDTTLDTKFSMDIQYGDFPIYDNINAAINTLKGTDTTYKPADMANEILNAIPDVEVTDDIVSVTDAAAYPAEKLEFSIEPVQEGSGDPSPENVRPISGWTGVNGKRTGVNVWDEEWELGGLVWITGEPVNANDRIRSKTFCPCMPNVVYYGTKRFAFFFYDANQNFIEYRYNNSTTKLITTPNDAHYFKVLVENTITYNHDISINYPSTDTEYHAYTGTSIPITFPTEAGTVYGGKVDVVNGKLRVGWIKKILDGVNNAVTADGTAPNYHYYIVPISPDIGINTESKLGSLLCDTFVVGSIGLGHCYITNNGTWFLFVLPDQTITTISAANQWLQSHNVEIVYELATPIEYDITPQQVQMLLGDNNVWCDTGDTTLKYKVDLGRYIQKLQAN